jgi:hypothetical protein
MRIPLVKDALGTQNTTSLTYIQLPDKGENLTQKSVVGPRCNEV